MLRRLRDEERGVAMVIAVSVAFVVLILSTVVVAQSIHSLESSGYDRERLLSVNAAEAGTNQWYAYLQTTPALSMSADPGCNAATGRLSIAQTVQSGPSPAAFNAVGTFYGSDGVTTMNCSTFTDTNFPSFVKVRSTGTINGSPNRTLETYVRLTPNYGGFGAAILAVNGTTVTNSFTINGNSGNDGDMYFLNGDFRVTNSMTLSGNIYVPNGTAQIENTSTVKGNVWANGNVTLQNSATIQGDALSSSGNIGGVGTINDDATAAGTVTTTNLTIGGIVTQGVTMPAVPTQTFPQITSNTAPWIASGYTLVDYSANPGADKCAKARDWIKNTWPLASSPTNALIRIDQTCQFPQASAPNNETYSIKGNLAILSDGSFNLNNQSTWNGTTGSIKQIHFISVYPAASCTGTKNINVGNNTNFNVYTNVSFYTPCAASMSNQNAFSGQVLSKDITIGNNFKMNYKPVLVPGITGITGFKQDIAYIHE
jgi:Tfp pilus assembly protein PilX